MNATFAPATAARATPVARTSATPSATPSATARSTDPAPGARLAAALRTWPGVTAEPGRPEAVTFVYGRRELGHIHGDSHADLPFPQKLRTVLIEERRAEPHRLRPESGWVSVCLATPGGVEKALALFRLNYDRIVRHHEPAEDLPAD